MQTNIGGKEGEEEALKGIAHWGNNNYHYKLQLGEQLVLHVCGMEIHYHDIQHWFDNCQSYITNIALVPRFKMTSLKSDVKFVTLIVCL